MKDKLAASIGPVFWSDLQAHAERGAIIVLDAGLGLVEVGVAIASDDVPRVEAWLEKKLLTKPSEEELALWSTAAADKWDALVVAPYVLVQERGSAGQVAQQK